MVRFASKGTFRHNHIVLKTVFIVALFLFILFAYLLYSYQSVLLSPSSVLNNSFGNFLFWVFIIGMLITLIVVAFVLYYFLYESDNMKYSSGLSN